MTKSMEGKVALVTGASSGIGRASAMAFAREGAKVIVNANVSIEGGEETVRMIEEIGGEATFIKADVASAAEVEAMVSKAIQTYGRLDYAHNNAGIAFPSKQVHEYTEVDWDKVIGINLKGMWLCMKYEIPEMLKQGKGAIVNTGSMASLGAVPNALGYIVSKHGVIGLTRAAAVEYAKSGIRVNAVCPGVIATPLIERGYGHNPDAAEAARISQRPIERLGTPEEVAEAVVWLCSDAASFVLGTAMVVDGGKSIFQITPGKRA
ncbi:SDR family oxidoreductase [Chloroflexota bacterium]